MRYFYFVIMGCFIIGQVQASSSVSSKILEEGQLKSQKVASGIVDMALKKSRCAGWIETQIPADSFSKMRNFHHCVHVVLANESVNVAMDSGAVTECNWVLDHHMPKMPRKKHHGPKNPAMMSSVHALCNVLFPREKKSL